MKFSLIVPVYNCLEDLPACINSVLQQTFSDFELLIVDDGSNDGTSDFCNQLAAQDSRIQIFHKENGGASSARNLGLKHAIGDYILFIDGDDTIEPDLLEQISLVLSASAPQMLIFGMAFDYYSDAGRLVKTNDLSVKHTGFFSADELLTSFSEFFNDNALSSACNKAFSGVILRENRLLFSEDMTLYEDLDFVLRYLLHCDQIVCMDHVFYHYRLPPETTFVNPRVLNLNILQQNLEILVKSGLQLHSSSAAKILADLCVQVYDMHLLADFHIRQDMPRIISEMIHSSALQSLSENGSIPSSSSSLSWPMIRDGNSRSLYTSLTKRKLICKVKQIVKPALKRLGFFH